MDKPEVGTDMGCRSSAGLGGDGYCRPAAMAHPAAVVGSYPSCSLAGGMVDVEVAEFGRNWRCMEVVGLGCLEGGVGSSALQ